ncbi:N-acetylmuramidase domain-containing protein, partial [Paracoccus rhizosphaerae]
MKLNAAAALRTCSWGLGQAMGFNHRAAGYANASAMVAAFCESEATGVEAVGRFIESESMDDELPATTDQAGPVAYLCRSQCLFRPLGVR